VARKARDADVILVFYAGHGLQDQGKNYLAPIDATISDETDLRRRFVRLDDVLDDLAEAKGARILLLDACRDNGAVEALRAAVPKSRSAGISLGLARIPEASGQLIAFATQPDRIAADGDGADSPFTTALIAHLGEPGIEPRTALTRVRVDVARATNQKQIPEVSDSLIGEIYLSRAALEPHGQSTPSGSRWPEPIYGNSVLQKIDPIVTNLASPADKWIRLEAAVVFANGAIADPQAVATKIREEILAYCRTLTLDQLKGPSALQHLSEDLSKRVQLRTNGAVTELVIETLSVQ